MTTTICIPQFSELWLRTVICLNIDFVSFDFFELFVRNYSACDDYDNDERNSELIIS